MKKGNIKWFFLFLLLLLNVFVWVEIIRENTEADLRVVFLDVGQGDAVFVEAGNGNQVLIDGGKNDKVLRELSKEMSFFDRSIDVIIATHPDSDHIGGLVPVLKRFKNEIYVESGALSNTLVYKSLENSLKDSGVKRVLAKRGMVIDLGGGVFLRVLFPDRDVSGVDPNIASIILQVVYGNTSFMLSGDAPQSIENYIASVYGNSIESEVLKVGHHGSHTSTSELFLGLVEPEFSVISAGKNNSYGHPHQDVVSRLENFNVKVLETSKEGSVTFTSNGEVVRLLNSKF